MATKVLCDWTSLQEEELDELILQADLSIIQNLFIVIVYITIFVVLLLFLIVEVIIKS